MRINFAFLLDLLVERNLGLILNRNVYSHPTPVNAYQLPEVGSPHSLTSAPICNTGSQVNRIQDIWIFCGLKDSPLRIEGLRQN